MIGQEVEVNGRIGIVISIRHDIEMGTLWLVQFDDCCTREYRAPIPQEE